MLTIVDLMKENRNDRRKSERYIKEIKKFRTEKRLEKSKAFRK